MNFCTKCGYPMTDGGTFCTQCGAKTTEDFPPQQQIYPVPTAYPQQEQQPFQQPYQQPYQNPYQQNIPYHNPYASYSRQSPYGDPYAVSVPDADAVSAVELIRKCGSSPLFLAGVIIFTISIFVNFFSYIFATQTSFGSLADYGLSEIFDYSHGFDHAAVSNSVSAETETFLNFNYEYYDDNYYYYDDYFVSLAMIIATVFMFLGISLPQILIAIGLWLIYTRCTKRDNAPLKTTGFSMVKGVHIYFLIAQMALAGLLLLFILLGIMVDMANYYDADPLFAFIIVGVAGILVAYFLAYNIAVFKIINNIKSILLRGKTPPDFSLMLPILVFITLGVQLFLPFLLTLIGYDATSFNFFSLIRVAASAILAITFIKFRGEYKNMKSKTQSFIQTQ
ncbi:MAG: zinc ribbon domain-containing protein [Oscillospiraceae bacterium]|nr:zinc ribbon domain-containing protein [Oscillospiraceae bacterium]